MSWVKFQHGFAADQDLGLFEHNLNLASQTGVDYGRRGDRGALLYATTSTLRRVLGVDLPKISIGYGTYVADGLTAMSGEVAFLRLYEGSTEHVQFRVNPDRSISVYNGSDLVTPIHTSDPDVVPTDVSTFFLAVVEIGNASPVTFYINEIPVIAEATLDTQNGGTGVVNEVQWGDGQFIFGDPLMGMHVNDIYVGDPDDVDFRLLHDVRFERMAVNSDVAVDFIPDGGGTNHSKVSEVPFSAAQKVTSAVPGDQDRYGVAAGVLTYDDIVSIAVVGQMGKDGGTASARLGFTDDGNEFDGATHALSITSQVVQDIATERPVSGDPWDAAARDALAIGPENVS